MVASDVLNRVRVVLQDSGVRWPDSELLLFLSSAQRAVVEVRPSANTAYRKYTLADGTKQSVGSADFRVLDVVRNQNVTTDAPGRAVRYVDRDALNASDPDWHISTPTTSVRNWTDDPRDAKTFYVYPRAIGSKSCVQVLASVLPGPVAATGSTLDLSDDYMNALEAFVLYKAFSKDSEFANPQKAANHLSIFQTLMGAKPQSEVRASPQYNDKGANPDAASRAGGV